MNIPVTGDRLYDFVLVIILVIIGIGMAFKADNKWGYLLVVVAGYWAFRLVQIWL